MCLSSRRACSGVRMKILRSTVLWLKVFQEIVVQCWAYTAGDRPSFRDLLDMLERLPKKRLNRSPSFPISRSYESMFWKTVVGISTCCYIWTYGLVTLNANNPTTGQGVGNEVMLESIQHVCFSRLSSARNWFCRRRRGKGKMRVVERRQQECCSLPVAPSWRVQLNCIYAHAQNRLHYALGHRLHSKDYLILHA